MTISKISTGDLDVEYDLVLILDGLPETERARWRISESLREFLAANGLHQLQSSCNNAAMVFRTLDYALRLAHQGRVFCVHFVCHGSKAGLWIKATSERIPWAKLRGRLQALNTLLKGRLVVNMTSCFGLHGLRIDDLLSGPQPFYGLVGPAQKITMRDAARVSKLFYGKQLEGKPIERALEEINQEAGREILYGISTELYRRHRRQASKPSGRPSSERSNPRMQRTREERA